MSTVRAAFNISATIVKSLVKVAGFGFVADAIEGGQEIYQLACSLKDETFRSAEAQMSGALRNSITDELASIEDQLGRSGHDEKSIDLFIGRLETSTKRTIARLLDDDNALCKSITEAKTFHAYVLKQSTQVRADYTPGERKYLDSLLHCVAREYLILAPKSPNYNKAVLKATVEELSKILTALEELKDGQQELKNGQQEIKNGQQQLKSSFESLRTTIENEHTIRHNKQLNNDVWGSRPATLKHWIERDPTSNGTSLHDTIFNSPSSQPGSRCVLVGRAGSGKTSVAASIARRCESDKWSLVAWVDASTRSTIESGLIALGESVLCMQTNTQQDQRLRVEQVLATFRNSSKNKCLFVYDNVEGVDYLDGVLPDGPGVHVVVTTRRNSGWSNQEGWNIYALGNFTRDESVKLLISVTKDPDRETADKLASDLGNLPLAIAQAAATCSRYYANLQDYYADLKATNIEELLEPIEGGHYSKGAIASLQLAASSTLSSIRDPHVLTEAQTILAALCYLAESGVPTQWFKSRNYLPSQKAFKVLQDSSIIDQSNDGKTTSIHRLQAHALRTSHDSHIAHEGTLITSHFLDKINRTQHDEDINIRSHPRQITYQLINQFSTLCSQSYSKALFDYPQVQQCLFDTLNIAVNSDLYSEAFRLAQAFSITERAIGTSHPKITRARLDLAHAHSMASQYDIAASLEQVTITHFLNTLGPAHLDTLRARTQHVLTYRLAGLYVNAIAVNKEIIADLTNTYGPQHPDTIHARENLASTYRWAKQYINAITVHKEIIAQLTSTLGPEHPDTITALTQAVSTFRFSAPDANVTTFVEEIVANLTNILGPEDPDTIMARDELAWTYHRAGQYADAIAVHKEIIAQLTSTLGPEDPDTIKARDELAWTCRAAGQYADAITMYQEIIADLTNTHGPQHPDTIKARKNLASTYDGAGQYTDAIAVHEEIIADLTNTHGPQHPDTITALTQAVSTFRFSAPDANVTTFIEEIVANLTNILGTKHPDTIRARNQLASAYFLAKQYADAITMYQEIIADLTNTHGPQHTDTIKARNQLAWTYRYAGQYADAVAVHEEIIAQLTSTRGPEHHDTIEARDELAWTYQYAGQYADAIAVHKAIIADLTNTLDPQHPDTIRARENLASTYDGAGQYTDAIASRKEIIADLTNTHGPQHPDTIKAHNELAWTYRYAGQYADAVAVHEEIIAQLTSTRGPEHPDTIKARDELASTYQRAEQYAKAIAIFEATLADCITGLGRDNSLTKTVRENLEAARQELKQQEEDSAAE